MVSRNDSAAIPREVIVRLDDRAARVRECLSAQLEQDYPLTYERVYWLVCGVTDYLSPLLKVERQDDDQEPVSPQTEFGI